jgi:hypothetical protein
MATTPTQAPPTSAPVVTPMTQADIAAMIADAVAKVRGEANTSAPWYVPPWSVWLAVGLYVMAFWILYVLSPAKGQEPSELFKTLAGAIVLTAFVNGVVAAVFSANRDSQKKNDVIATQAKIIDRQAS